MLTPVFPLPEKSQKECSLSKQLIPDLDYSIPLIPHSKLKLSCLKVHIPPLTKFRPETPCGVKRSHAKNFRNRNCGFPTIKLF